MGEHTLKWTYEVHQLSEGYSAIVYDEHGQAIADHLTEERAAMVAAAPKLLEALQWALAELRGRTRYTNPQQPLNCFDEADAAVAMALCIPHPGPAPVSGGGEGRVE